MVAWLVQQCGVAAATAREWVTAAAKLQELPKISDALAQGKLSFDQVKPLVEVAKPATDAQLAEQATHWSAKQVRELAIAARAQSDGQATGFYARRFLRFDDRRRMLTGILPEEQYAVVKGSLVARASRRLKERTPFDQRMADALVAVCKQDVAGKPTEGGEVPTSRRHAAQPTHRGRARRPELPRRRRRRRRARRARTPVAGGGPPARLRRQGRGVGGRAERTVASTSAGPAAIPPTPSASRSGVATRDVGSPAARTQSSPTCTTCCTGRAAARPTCATSWNSATSTIASCMRWAGSCRVTPTSS